MNYGLPTSVEIDGVDYAIRYDFRVILDIFEVLNDPDLEQWERILAALQIFYVDFDLLTDYNTAAVECFKFINGGNEDDTQKKRSPKLLDWEQDFPYIVAPVNRILGKEIRAIPYDDETNTGGLHWWTFLSAYTEIGECFFAQVVRIRDMKARGKALDKSDREFYNRNGDIIDIKTHYSDAERDLLSAWTGEVK
jgi:hypothetical protein